MPKKTKEVDELSAPFRRAAQEILETRLPTQQMRKAVAESVGSSLKSLNTFIYEGKGGIDFALACLIKASAMSEKDVERALERAKQGLNFSDFDKRWHAIPMSDDERQHWLAVMEIFYSTAREKKAPQG